MGKPLSLLTNNITKIKQNKTFKLSIMLLFKTPSIENLTEEVGTSRPRKTPSNTYIESTGSCARDRDRNIQNEPTSRETTLKKENALSESKQTKKRNGRRES